MIEEATLKNLQIEDNVKDSKNSMGASDNAIKMAKPSTDSPTVDNRQRERSVSNNSKPTFAEMLPRNSKRKHMTNQILHQVLNKMSRTLGPVHLPRQRAQSSSAEKPEVRS